MPTASVRFYGSLNDFLPPARRQSTLVAAFDGHPSIKDVVEALGVPHPEIDLLIVDGRSVDFAYRVSDGNRIAAYPRFEQVDLTPAGADSDTASATGIDSAAANANIHAGAAAPLVHLQPQPRHEPRFVADVHLGRLTAYLRLAGFDTLYRNDYADTELAAIASDEDRILLTRDVGLLKHTIVRRGHFVRATQPAGQLVEVLREFDLAARAAPFTRCLRCNARLQIVDKAHIEHLLPERTRECHDTFSRCPSCDRLYWPGSHHARMQHFLELALGEAARPTRRTRS